MSNDYYNVAASITRHTLARSSAILSAFQAIASGFEKLPAKDALHQGTTTFSEATGVANTYAVEMPLTLTNYARGQHFRVLINVTNSGPSTLDVDGLGARSIRRVDGTHVEEGDLTYGDVADFVFDGTNMVLGGSYRSHMAGMASNLGADLSFTGNVSFESIVGNAIQANPTDGTLGKLLTTGAFGLGATLHVTGDLNDPLKNGFYYASGGAANRYRGNGFFLHQQYGNDHASQLYLPATGDLEFGLRRKVAGVWEDWIDLLPVRGSNANGHYIRFPDGTQICQSETFTTDVDEAAGGIYRTATPIIWTFPASFISADGLTGFVTVLGNSKSHWGSLRSTVGTQAEVSIFSPNIATGRLFRATAIGRWN